MFEKSLPAALAATAVAALALVPAGPATAATAAAAAAAVTVEIRPGQVSTLKQSNSKFNCPTNEVLVGRGHRGDENGWTQYEYGWISYSG